MDSAKDYISALEADMIEQFRGRPNLEVYQKALARQLNELYVFFYELYAYRWIQTAQGAQLDGIGNIVALSRMDALILSQMSGENVPMDDETYRLYLMWKMILNTSTATYPEIHRALSLFWDKTPLYHEDTNYPATMFFTVPAVSGDVGANVLSIAAKIKAAGVALHLVMAVDLESELFVGGRPVNTRSTFKLQDHILEDADIPGGDLFIGSSVMAMQSAFDLTTDSG